MAFPPNCTDIYVKFSSYRQAPKTSEEVISKRRKIKTIFLPETRKQPYWVAERIRNSVGSTVLHTQILKMLRGSSSGVKGSVLSICKSARGMIWHCVVNYVPHPVCKLSKILISQPVARFSWATSSRTSHHRCCCLCLSSSERRVRRCFQCITLF